MSGAVSLDELAAIWVERWLVYGGGLIADSHTARLSVSMRMDDWRWRSHYAAQRHWHNGWMTGRWRELSELMELIPGLYDAVVAHVLEHGQPGGVGSKCMTRRGPHVTWQTKCEVADRTVAT
jgi:hypothetical protein